MNWKWNWHSVLLTTAISTVIFAGGFGLYKHYSNTANGFDPKLSAVASDLNGHTVGMPFAQAWPFDNAQNIEVVRVFGKKTGVQPDTVTFFAQIRSTANVVPEKREEKKEKDKKEEKKDAKEVKTVRVKVEGVVKLTYEKGGSEWFLVQVDNMTLRATMEEPAHQ
jgi:hypothetical protein